MPQVMQLTVGKRYLNKKNGQRVTLRYIGTLPPHTESQVTWLGIEYDDKAYGKHSGTYQGQQVFSAVQPGSGAFVKLSSGMLINGPTFLDALEERYGKIQPDQADRAPSAPPGALAGGVDKVALGNSGIVVEAPGMDGVKARVGKLEKLREIGMSGEGVSKLGGSVEQQSAMTDRLSGVRILDLSGSLLETWTDLAEIVDHLTGLKTLVLNNSRFDPLPSAAREHTLLCRLQASFETVTELHLGNCRLDWSEVIAISDLFPSLTVLHLNDNDTLDKLQDPGNDLQLLEVFSLSGCGITSWVDIETAAGGLPCLTTLDLSRVPLPNIPPLLQAPASFNKALSSMILYQTPLSTWADIDALEEWTAGNLKSLRITLQGLDDDYDDNSPPPAVDPKKMSGRARSDRPMLIAKLSGLTFLNSSPISEAERRDSETWYTHYLDHLDMDQRAGHGRYTELKAKHRDADAEIAPQQQQTHSSVLKSKLITLHLILANGRKTEINILPSAPISLLRKKVARKIGKDTEGTRLWTTRTIGGVMDKVAEVEDGHETGWWANHDDWLHVE